MCRITQSTEQRQTILNSVNPVTGTPKGSIATAETGYAFKNWTKDGVVVSWNAELKPEDIAKVGGLYVASEYVANFGWMTTETISRMSTRLKVTYSAVNGKRGPEGSAVCDAV